MNWVLRPAVRPLPGFNCTVSEFWFWIFSRFQMALFSVSIPFSTPPYTSSNSFSTRSRPNIGNPDVNKKPIADSSAVPPFCLNLYRSPPLRLFLHLAHFRFSDSFRFVSNISSGAFLSPSVKVLSVGVSVTSCRVIRAPLELGPTSVSSRAPATILVGRRGSYSEFES